MNVFEKVLIFLDGSMTKPQMYGWFHLLSLFVLFISIILIKIKYNKLDNTKIKKILVIYSVICLVFEVYKQINFSFNYDQLHSWWEYQWYAFPFQFCSCPMYIALIAGLTKNKKLEAALYTFLATYGLIAGIAVMIYPSTVFVETIGINIQTMFHHGAMVFIGFLLILNNKIKHDFKALLSTISVFSSCVFIALLIDISTYYLKINDGLKMFFISPFHQSELPVFSLIYDKVSYPIFLIIYIAIFSLGAFIILMLTKPIKKPVY